MPLHANALELIRANLTALRNGQRVKAVSLGVLTSVQLDAINRQRASHGSPLPPIIAEVIFLGSHIYKRRILEDGYGIEDIIDQIVSGMNSASEFLKTPTMTALENPIARSDRYGNRVRDRVIFECTTRHPRPELFSVMPKGDVVKPKKKGR